MPREGRFTSWRPSRGLRTTAWWATVTVLVLMVINNVAHRRAAGTKPVPRGAFGSPNALRPADPEQHPVATPITVPGLAHDHDAGDGGADGKSPAVATVDPEDVTGDAPHNHHGHDRGAGKHQDAAHDNAAAHGDKGSSWSPAGTTAEAELLQRSLLEHFAAREAARPAPGRGCFLALVRHTDEGLRRLVRLLGNVKEQFPVMARRYPFVAFLESHVDTAHVTKRIEELAGFKPGTKVGGRYPLAHVFPAGVILAVLKDEDFGLVPNYVPDQHSWPYSAHNYWGIPYRHMCRFFGVRVMLQPALDAFDYYMRLDTDSYILAPARTTVVVPTKLMPWDKGHRFPVGGAVAGSSADDHLAADSANAAAAGLSTARFSSHGLDVLGLEELEVDVDLFQEMAVRGSVYGFNMVHPQTMREFMAGLFETYDGFVRKEIADHHAKPGDPSLPFRGGGVGDRDSQEGVRHGGGPSPFKAPRGLGLHFWDNFEVVDLRLFRTKPRAPIRPMGLESAEDAANIGADTSSGDAAGDDEGKGQASDGAAEGPSKAHLDRAQSVRRWLSAVDHAAGFYTHRWGDAEVRTLTMTLFLSQKEFLFFDTLSYQHYHNIHCPADNGDGREDGHGPRRDKSTKKAKSGGGDDGAHKSLFDAAANVEELIPQIAGEYQEALKDTARTTTAVLSRHDAVDAVLRRLSPGRERVDDEMRAACYEEAGKSYGRNSKGSGSANMRPAEHSPNNKFFWDQEWPQV